MIQNNQNDHRAGRPRQGAWSFCLVLVVSCGPLAGCQNTKLFKDFTPENKYYIGRSVSAQILVKYKVYEDREATRYVNLLGQTLAKFSDVPEVFQGYHFVILDSAEINAFAAPGAFIYITRGMLRVCATEDELAAVLAHEIGHIQYEHGVKVIRKARGIASMVKLGKMIAQAVGSEQVKELTKEFGDDIGKFGDTLFVKGYGRTAEKEADSVAIEVMYRTGFDPNAAVTMLQKMEKRLGKGKGGFGSTHPPPSVRIKAIKPLLKPSTRAPVNAARQARFNKALARARG